MKRTALIETRQAMVAQLPVTGELLRGSLLGATGRVVGQAKRFAKEIDEGVKQVPNLRRQLELERLRRELETMVPRVQQVIRQTKTRVFAGDTHAAGKIVSLFEPTTEVIRKGKAGKPTEFGKMVKLQEAENQIVIAYKVYDQRPSDQDILMAAIETHQARLGRTPHLVGADAGFYSGKNEAAAKAKGVKHVCIPNRSGKSPERKREQKKRWFRNGWTGGWRGGVHSYDHYHSTAHEALGIVAGSAKMRLGGDGGTFVDLNAGDAVVIPAGVAHKGEAASPDLLILGAYPGGRVPTCGSQARATASERSLRSRRRCRSPRPIR